MRKKFIFCIWLSAVLCIGGVCLINFSQDIYAAGDRNKKFVKTKNKCSKCSCSGYWGYKHLNGTYEGACSNRDRHGYMCGHGPEKHGLRKW